MERETIGRMQDGNKVQANQPALVEATTCIEVVIMPQREVVAQQDHGQRLDIGIGL